MNETSKFTLLLSVGVTLLFGISLLPDSLADTIHLKKLDLESFSKIEPADSNPKDLQKVNLAATESADSTQSDETVAQQNRKSTCNTDLDTTKQNVLIFGDSMVEEMRLRLADYTNQNGHRLTSIIWYSSTTELWATTDTLDYFLKQIHPTHIFISLGGNELYVRDLKKREKYIHEIMSRVGNIPTIWIGPPNWCKDTGINDILLKEMGEKAYFPSYTLKFERKSDKHHPTRNSAANWMDEVIKWMNGGKSIHPFRLNVPEKVNHKHHTIVLKPLNTTKKN